MVSLLFSPVLGATSAALAGTLLFHHSEYKVYFIYMIYNNKIRKYYI